jgi:hypothetical protein
MEYAGFNWAPIERCDLDRMVADLDDPGFMVAARMHSPSITARELISTRRDLARNGDHITLVATDEQGLICGWAALVPCPSDRDALETSTYLHPRVWGTHVNVACKSLLWTVGRELLGRRVIMSINEINSRSLRANVLLFPHSPRRRIWESSKNRFSVNIEMDRPPDGFMPLNAEQLLDLRALLDPLAGFQRLKRPD